MAIVEYGLPALANGNGRAACHRVYRPKSIVELPMSDATLGSNQDLDWNVLTGTWLEIMASDGLHRTCSPLEVLRDASMVKCIALGNPIDLFAAHRFLLTLLYWKADAGGGVIKVRESLLHGRIPKAVLDAIAEAAPSFDLFDAEAPFLQDPESEGTKNSGLKSPGSLFSEMATGTNVAHFHHGDDKDTRLCLRCATIGMIRLVPWTQSGGAGLSPSVHNAPPIMALASGDNLSRTLGLNLVPLQGPAGDAKWFGRFVPSDRTGEIPYLEAFTWNPRRVLLPQPELGGSCWRCGDTESATVGRLVFMKNEETKSNKKGQANIPFNWQDPSAFYNSDPNRPFTTIKSGDESRATTGSDLRLRLAPRVNTPVRPAVFTGNEEHQSWSLIVPCTNPANNKTFDHRRVDISNLTEEAIQAEVPVEEIFRPRKGMDGWNDPDRSRTYPGSERFVRAASRLLSHSDWSVLAGAEYKGANESPAAFDILTGLLWPMRAVTTGLPSRNVAWLVLKLMASVPDRARTLGGGDTFSPLKDLPKRGASLRSSTKGTGHFDEYPISLPTGQRLESELRTSIARNIKKRPPQAINWAGLCHDLDRLID